MASVLLVDESSVDRKLAGALLKKRANLDPVYANEGGEALAMLERAAPSIVVTSVAMRGMDGVELVERIRALYPHVPVVLVTGPGEEDAALAALAGGAASFARRRALEKELPPIVERVLEVARVEPSPKKLLRWLAETESRYVLDNDPASLPSLVAHLETALAQMGLCDATGSLQAGVAVREALFNAMIHGNLELGGELHEVPEEELLAMVAARRAQHPYADRKLHLNAKLTKDAARYVIRDEGPGFDPHGFFGAESSAALLGDRGRGLLLLRTFMDEVRFNERGNEVSLVKRRKARPSDVLELTGIEL